MKSFVGLALIVGALGLVSACGATTKLAKHQDVAVSLPDATQALYDIEQKTYATYHYSQATHDALLEKEFAVVKAGHAYEKAVAACSQPAGCASVDTAAKALNDALDRLNGVVPNVDGVKVAIANGIAAVRALLPKTSAGLGAIPVSRSQEIPAPGVMLILGLLEEVGALWVSLRAKAAANGATPEQLAAADAKFTGLENTIEAELAKDKASNPTA